MVGANYGIMNLRLNHAMKSKLSSIVRKEDYHGTEQKRPQRKKIKRR